MAQLKDLIVSGAARILGKLYASEFVGKLTGNADTATKATQDSGGQQINTTYIKGLSVSGKTITYTKGNGTTGTITTQDTVYTHPTSSGNKHIPSGGSSGQILRWSADGTAAWGTDNNTTYSNATTSASGLMSNTDKTKLDGIATGANKYTHPTYTARSAGFYKVTVDGSGHVSNATAVAKSDITALGIPGTNTTYSAFTKATADAAGGSGLVPAPAKGQQGLYLRGDGTWATPTNTTYSAATTSASGLMTADMVTKLNGIATGANAYSHPTYTAKSSGLYKVTVDSTGHVSATTAVTKADITALGIPGSDTNTDTKVTQTAVNNSTYSNWRTIIWGASNNATEGFTPTTVTDGVYSDKNLTYQPSTGTLRATTFKGNLAWSNITGKPSSYTPASHTHDYAGSSSAGGSATSAVKLDTATAGSATQPVYFSGGKPVACTYTLGKSVPSNAVFTDTNTTYPFYNKTIDSNFTTKFRTETKGNTSSGDYIATIRCDTASISNAPQYGTGLAWGRGDTHGYLYISYSSPQLFVGGGNADKLNWIKQVSFTDHTHSYLPLSGGILSGTNQTPLIINGVSNNEASIAYRYNGDATKQWVIGPGAGAGNMDYFGFYREGVGRMTCISSSGNIDTNGYLQANGLINTYSEYQSQRGNRDWRFGSGTGTGDQNWFGFYDYSSGYHGGIYGPEHILRMNGEIQSTSANAFRAIWGNYGWIIRNDGANLYLMPTNSGDAYGSWAETWSRFDLGTGQMFIRNSSVDGGGCYPPILTNDSTNRVFSITNNADSSLKIHMQNRDISGVYVTKYVSFANSDIRLKENISDTSVSDALSAINKIKLHQFDWKSSKEHQNIGFIADELEQLDSKFAIGGGWDDEEHKNMNVKSIDTFYMLGYIVKGIQELSSQVEFLKEENKELKEKLNA